MSAGKLALEQKGNERTLVEHRAAASLVRDSSQPLMLRSQWLPWVEQRVIMLAPGAPLSLRVWRNGRVLELVLTRPPAGP
jgi:hypothetical protein